MLATKQLCTCCSCAENIDFTVFELRSVLNAKNALYIYIFFIKQQCLLMSYDSQA